MTPLWTRVRFVGVDSALSSEDSSSTDLRWIINEDHQNEDRSTYNLTSLRFKVDDTELGVGVGGLGNLVRLQEQVKSSIKQKE